MIKQSLVLYKFRSISLKSKLTENNQKKIVRKDSSCQIFELEIFEKSSSEKFFFFFGKMKLMNGKLTFPENN